MDAWTELQSSAVRVPEGVVFRDMADETILLNVATGRYHGIDRIGARFFAAIREAPCVGEAVPALATEYGQDEAVISRDLRRFCEQLLVFGLIELAPPRAPR